MTLKQALISESFYREPEAPNVIYINLSQIPNVEKLIEEIFKEGYECGLNDEWVLETVMDTEKQDFNALTAWQVNKERWLGK